MVLVELQVNDQPAHVVIGIGTNGTFERTMPLVLGENPFVVLARDPAGNTSEPISLTDRKSVV